LTSKDDKEEQFKFVIGSSGWSEGHLDDELIQESWLISDIGPKEALSREDDTKMLWNRAMKNMGGSDKYMANSPLDPQWN
jgi:putative transcriptional regulator